MTCHEIDRLVTPFIDEECSAEERARVARHLRECPPCRERVDAEASARQMLHTHATAAATTLRPRVFRLGQPALPMRPTSLATIAGVAGAAFLTLWLRTTPVVAVGVIGDSTCAHDHRGFTTRFNVDDRECTLGCVKLGAEFVLVTETRIYRIDNQKLPELASLASRRVQIKGKLDGDRIIVASMTATESN